MSRLLVEHIEPAVWGKEAPPEKRVIWLQRLSDLVNRPALNRVTAAGNGVVVSASGTTQSTGIGTAQIQPLRYSELTNKIRVTFNLNSIGPAYLYIYRTNGAIPANGAAPNAGDVIVGGDAFAGGPTASGVNQAHSFSFLDENLDKTKQYRYYLAVQAPNGNTLNVVSSSHIVMERS